MAVVVVVAKRRRRCNCKHDDDNDERARAVVGDGEAIINDGKKLKGRSNAAVDLRCIPTMMMMIDGGDDGRVRCEMRFGARPAKRTMHRRRYR